MNKWICKKLAQLIAKLADKMDKYMIKKKYWDDQWYLNWKDELNRISIDSDRTQF